MPNCSICKEPGPDFTCRKCLFGRADGGPPRRRGAEAPKPMRWSKPPDRPSYDALLRLANKDRAAPGGADPGASRDDATGFEADTAEVGGSRLSAAERAARARAELEAGERLDRQKGDGGSKRKPGADREPAPEKEKERRPEAAGVGEKAESAAGARASLDMRTEPILPDFEPHAAPKRSDSVPEVLQPIDSVESEDARAPSRVHGPEETACEATTSEIDVSSVVESFAEAFFDSVEVTPPVGPKTSETAAPAVAQPAPVVPAAPATPVAPVAPATPEAKPAAQPQVARPAPGGDGPAPAVGKPAPQPARKPERRPEEAPQPAPEVVRPAAAPLELEPTAAKPARVRRAGELDIPISVRFDAPWAPADGEPVVHMMVTLSPDGAPLMQGRTGAVGHVILALDVSASMNRPDRYPILTHALKGLLRELAARNEGHVLVSVVAFAYGSETLVRAEPVTELDPDEVISRLDGWDKRFTRYTDVVGALHRAGRLARDSVAADKAMPVRIYLLTDGHPQDMAGARDVMSKIARLPVDVHGFVFGEDADVDGVAQLVGGSRGGTVKHVRPDTLAQAFERIGAVAHDVVANRSLLDVELRDGVTGGDAWRYRPARHRFPNGSFVRGVRFSTDLGTLETGRSYSMLFKLRLRRSKAGESEVCRIALRVPGWGGPRLFEKLVQIPRRADAGQPAKDVEVQAAVDILAALDGNDGAATLRALRLRRDIYVQERRDPHVIAVIGKAIAEMERHGNLAALTPAEHAALTSHTLTTHVRARDASAAAPTAPDAARPAAEQSGAGKRGS